MKTFLFATLLLITVSAFGASPVKAETPNQMARAIADAYQEKTLGKLDGKVLIRGKIKVVIEHSLAEDGSPEQFKSRWFSSFAAIEKWLRSREHEELPGRVSKELKGCSKGFCGFNFDGGILHNQLYVKHITYGMYKGRPYVKTIRLLDGD